jgi:outer membrane receptor for Fe3+-dicitrate
LRIPEYFAFYPKNELLIQPVRFGSFGRFEIVKVLKDNDFCPVKFGEVDYLPGCLMGDVIV